MSFLAPLYLLGALAVIGPIVFHLVRRASKERQVFSSLMFLQPTPPKVTRRSRLEHVLLLLLRCAALALLALAFARPFFSQPATADGSPTARDRIVILVDTSASMRRGDLMRQAIDLASRALDDADTLDHVALYAFDRTVRPIVTFEQGSQISAAERAAMARQRLSELKATWGATRLDTALMAAADAIEEAETGDMAAPAGRRTIVLISDMQSGAEVQRLQAYEWPGQTSVVVRSLAVNRPTNAGLQVVADVQADEPSQDGPRAVRVRISNSSDAEREQFTLSWLSEDGGGAIGQPLQAYVPPGQSRVFRAPPTPTGEPGVRLTISGDDHDFDNTAWYSTPTPRPVKVLYVGNESADDSSSPLYFMRLGLQSTPLIDARLIERRADAQLDDDQVPDIRVMVVTDPPGAEGLAALGQYVKEGRTALLSLKGGASAAWSAALGSLLGTESVAVEDTAEDGYRLLTAIDFTHPLFEPFADPRFSDFSKIHVWKHRRVGFDGVADARVIARFDSGDAAVAEVAVGKGRLVVLTTTWSPRDSQLALSSKFVPLLYSVLDYAGVLGRQRLQYVVGDDVEAPSLTDGGSIAGQVRKPDGTVETIATTQAGEPMVFAGVDQPGLYTLSIGGAEHRIAVNLSAEESRTEPMAIEQLERLGVRLESDKPPVPPADEQAGQLQRDAELESRQQVWRWLIVAALGVLLVETATAGWLARGTKSATGSSNSQGAST